MFNYHQIIVITSGNEWNIHQTYKIGDGPDLVVESSGILLKIS